MFIETDKADEYNAKYIEGGYRNSLDEWCPEPMAYMPYLDLVKPDENGDIPEVPELGYGLLIRCARIEEMQPSGSRYNMDQLLVMSVVLPHAYAELVEKANFIALGINGESQTGNAFLEAEKIKKDIHSSVSDRSKFILKQELELQELLMESGLRTSKVEEKNLRKEFINALKYKNKISDPEYIKMMLDKIEKAKSARHSVRED